MDLAGKVPDTAITDALPGGRRAGTIHGKDPSIHKQHSSSNTY